MPQLDLVPLQRYAADETTLGEIARAALRLFAALSPESDDAAPVAPCDVNNASDAIKMLSDIQAPAVDRQAAARWLGKAATPAAREALEAVLHDADNAIRKSAAVALGEQGKRDGLDAPVGALRELLSDEAPDVREAAAAAIAACNTPESNDILSLLLNDYQPAVRQAAALALARRGDARALQPLIRLAAENTADLEHVAEELSNFNDRPAAEALIAIISESSNSAARLAAVRGLAQIGGRQYAPELRKLADAEADETIAAEIRVVIGKQAPDAQKHSSSEACGATAEPWKSTGEPDDLSE
jgi:HEAT repeat protein